MRTGDQYRESLRDGRKTYFDGRLITDMPNEPVLRDAVDNVAATYDKYFSAAPGATNPMLGVPNGVEELRSRTFAMADADIVLATTWQSLMTVMTASATVGETKPDYVERIKAYVEDAQTNDIRITECITDAKGDRASRPPSSTTPTCTPMWSTAPATGW